jgi:putative ABC transport system permease protein
MSLTFLQNAVSVGIDTLRINPLRTVLSTMGVIIGVGALVAVLSLGDGMERMARSEIERTTDVQTVSVSSRTTETVDGQTFPVRDYVVFTPADAQAMQQQIDGVSAMAMGVNARAAVDAPESGKRRMSNVNAVMAGLDDFLHMRFAEGRFFTRSEGERNAPVVVLSYRLANELASGRGAERMLGETVRVNGAPREVIGVLEAYKREVAYDAYVPFAAASTALPRTVGRRTPTVSLKAVNVESVAALRRNVEDWLGVRFGRWERRVSVETSQTRLEQATRGILTFKLFMAAMTGISLLVGGIGIMNVLLASVTERTREIGIRKAVGARRGDILMQFLAESVAISGAGSAIGAALGIAASFAITAYIRSSSGALFLEASFRWSTVLMAATSAVLIGLIFGTYPARRAARLDVIDAIRHE